MNKNQYYCYVCGKNVYKSFCLVTMSDSTDRVFLCCSDCIKQLDKDVIITRILTDNE